MESAQKLFTKMYEQARLQGAAGAGAQAGPDTQELVRQPAWFPG